MKVIESRSRSQEQKKVENPYSHNVKPSIGNNSGSIKHTAMKFAYSMHGVLGYGGSNGVTAIFVTRLEVTMHSRVVAVSLNRLEGNLVGQIYVLDRGRGKSL